MIKMKMPKNLPEILLFIFTVVVFYIYGGFEFDGILIGGGLAILLIIRIKLWEKIKW
jgi:hypothetical protein